MLRTRFSIRAAALAAALLLIASMAAIQADDHVGLDAGTLANSRGNNGSSSLSNPSCDVLQGNVACVPGAPPVACVTCNSSTYTTIGPAGGTGYNEGAAGGGNCGNKWNGQCNAAGVCVKAMMQINTCKFPVGNPTFQAN